jgi:hypothetical protein
MRSFEWFERTFEDKGGRTIPQFSMGAHAVSFGED